MSREGLLRLRKLVAHHPFALDAEVIRPVATQHEPGLLGHVLDLRTEAEGSACSAGRLAAAKSAMTTRLAAAASQRS